MEMSQKVMIVMDPIGSNGKTCIVEIKPGRYSIYIYVYIYIEPSLSSSKIHPNGFGSTKRRVLNKKDLAKKQRASCL